MLKIYTLTLGMYQTNTYIIHEENSKRCCWPRIEGSLDTLLDLHLESVRTVALLELTVPKVCIL